jgi:hypothetical protein
MEEAGKRDQLEYEVDDDDSNESEEESEKESNEESEEESDEESKKESNGSGTRTRMLLYINLCA